jgi:ubiquinone/menaquinone biosynthesis C-methylase UbiE
MQMDKLTAAEMVEPDLDLRPYRVSGTVPLPDYLVDTYWWAYLHPNAVRVFERQWLVNLILWGNFGRLRDLALAELGQRIVGRTLQVACVYGDFSPRLGQRLAPGAHLDVVDVAPVQLENAARKLQGLPQVALHHQDSTGLGFADASFDQVVVFFLLHEQPARVRVQTIAEALRVTRPGGKLVFVDYHRPTTWNPLRPLMRQVLRRLEPFALDLWEHDLERWLPTRDRPRVLCKQTYFGGLYQKVVMIR